MYRKREIREQRVWEKKGMTKPTEADLDAAQKKYDETAEKWRRARHHEQVAREEHEEAADELRRVMREMKK